MAIISGSLNYTTSGRKKKTTYSSSRRKSKKNAPIGKLVLTEGYRRDDGQDKYKSLNSGICNTTRDQLAELKKELSSQYTVAVPYNKGAYQVIPRDAVEDIGK